MGAVGNCATDGAKWLQRGRKQRIMKEKRCGAIDCAWYDTDCAFCEICEYDATNGDAYYEGQGVLDVADIILHRRRDAAR